MLAIIYKLEKWHHFIEEAVTLVKIWMNYKNLEYFITAKQLNW